MFFKFTAIVVITWTRGFKEVTAKIPARMFFFFYVLTLLSKQINRISGIDELIKYQRQFSSIEVIHFKDKLFFSTKVSQLGTLTFTLVFESVFFFFSYKGQSAVETNLVYLYSFIILMFIHMYIYLFLIHPSAYLFVHLFIHNFIQLFQLFIHSFFLSSIYLLFHSFNETSTDSLCVVMQPFLPRAERRDCVTTVRRTPVLQATNIMKYYKIALGRSIFCTVFKAV